MPGPSGSPPPVPKRHATPRPGRNNYLEELVRVGPIADNNVVLIEALHLGAHQGR
jgi:hypothetical protein